MNGFIENCSRTAPLTESAPQPAGPTCVQHVRSPAAAKDRHWREQWFILLQPRWYGLASLPGWQLRKLWPFLLQGTYFCGAHRSR